jgi:hypothetical protein
MLPRLLFAVLLCAVHTAVPAAQILACVVADVEGNTSYFGTATTATKLKCELANPDVMPTLAELYAAGWRLIDVLGGDHAIAMGNRGPSPLYLLERAGAAGAADSAPLKKQRDK